MDLVQANYNISRPVKKSFALHERDSLSPRVLAFSALTSILIPIGLILIYQTYAVNAGIALETGCHGPELPFGMLSGLLMIFQVRLYLKANNT